MSDGSQELPGASERPAPTNEWEGHDSPTLNLLRRARGGDSSATIEIFKRYEDYIASMIRFRVTGLARRRIGEEEVFQQAFLHAFEQIQNFDYRGEGSFRRWIYRVVRNKLTDLIRMEQRRSDLLTPEGELHLDGDGLSAMQESPAKSPSMDMRRREKDAAVHQAMSQLSKLEQELIYLREWEGLKWPEVCSILKCSLSTARDRFRASKRRLAHILREFDPGGN